MERKQVSSSNLKSIGFDPSDGILEVEFHNGGIYQYLNVPDATYFELMNAPSIGRYLNDYVKGRHQFKKIN